MPFKKQTYSKDEMKARAPKYRVCTTIPVRREDVRVAFTNQLVHCSPELLAWLCNDGSELIFHPSVDPQRFFVEFRCQFHSDVSNTVNFGLLPTVIQFCRVHGGLIKVIRSGSVLPASGGIYSDVFHSHACRVAEHLASHPKDQKAHARYASGTIDASLFLNQAS